MKFKENDVEKRENGKAHHDFNRSLSRTVRNMALQDFGANMAKELLKRGHVSFIEGDAAQAKKFCFEIGIDEKLIRQYEDWIFEQCYPIVRENDFTDSSSMFGQINTSVIHVT